MTKILFSGDPHLQMSRFAAAKSFLGWIDKVIEEQKPDIFINLGDLFHDHGVIRSEILSEFSSHVKRVCQKVPYFYVLGNHDMFRPNDSTYHALQPFSDKYRNFTVIDKVTDRDDMGITFVPYFANHDLFPKKTLPICVAHQTFIGCDFGGYRPENGVDPDTISAEIIISGHIHKKQSFGKVVYPGSPYSQSMKDIGQTKGLMLFDTDSYKTSFIQSPLPSWRSLEVEVGNIKSTVQSIEGSINQTDNWVVVFTGQRKEIAALLDSKEWKSLCNKTNISTRTKYIDTDRIERVKIHAHTTIDVAMEYVDKVYAGGLDKALIKKTMRQLFDNVDKNNV
jgi:DNA repair exonuclease SbcCD nuclease subunit